MYSLSTSNQKPTLHWLSRQWKQVQHNTCHMTQPMTGHMTTWNDMKYTTLRIHMSILKKHWQIHCSGWNIKKALDDYKTVNEVIVKYTNYVNVPINQFVLNWIILCGSLDFLICLKNKLQRSRNQFWVLAWPQTLYPLGYRTAIQ